MSKIRKLYFFDKKPVQEMISFLNSNINDKYINQLMFHPLMPLHHFLPLKIKFLPESFVLQVGKNLKGLITVAPTKCKYKKMEIQKLLFEENSLFDASELVQYVVSKYKAMGALTVIVKVDDYLPELLSMFVTKCGFSQISYEKTWRINKTIEASFDKKIFRAFRNSDAKAVTNLYNDALLPHFRPIMGREVREFKEDVFRGLSYYNEYKYVAVDPKTKAVIACIVLQTTDNENYLVDIIQSAWADLDINEALSYATYQIQKRKKRFGLFVRTKRYLNTAENQESFMINNNFECVQNQIVLTNSSARILKDTNQSIKYTMLTDFLPIKALPTQCNKL